MKREAHRGRTLRSWLLWSCALAVVVLAVSFAAGNEQRHEQGFDVFDESAHYDYVPLEHGHLPRSGPLISQATLRMVSCVGDAARRPAGCETKHRIAAELTPADGYNYEAVQQLPLAYLPYLLTTQANAASEDALVQARLSGFIWSVVGAGLLVWVGWLCRLSLLELCVVLFICLLSPVAVHAASTVTDDSSAIAAGGLVLATILVALRRRRALAFTGLVGRFGFQGGMKALT